MKMMFLFYFIFIVYGDVVWGQTVRRAQLLQYRAYMIDVVSETMQEVEDFQWCNLKIPDIHEDIKYEYFGRRFTGRISYTNGFVVSVQHVDIQQSFVQQVWTWDTSNQLGRVDVRARLRMHDVVLGFDVTTDVNGEQHRYTSTFTHQLLNFDFSILKDMNTKEITTTVTAVNPTNRANMMFVPSDEFSDLAGVAFQLESTIPGLQAWARDVFTPKLHNVVMNKVQFPDVCYNC